MKQRDEREYRRGKERKRESLRKMKDLYIWELANLRTCAVKLKYFLNLSLYAFQSSSARFELIVKERQKERQERGREREKEKTVYFEIETYFFFEIKHFFVF